MKTTRLPKEPLKKLNLKGPKLSRRQLGRAPRPNIWRRMCREAVDEIRKSEDQLWMELACKELNISPALLTEPTHSSARTALEMKMVQATRKWPKEIRLTAKVFP